MQPELPLMQALESATQRLAAVSESPRRDAQLLLSHVVQEPGGALSMAAAAAFEAAILRRLQGEPVAYITGEWEFWSLPIKVNRAVLIPRPETELLVEWALEISRLKALGHIADLGTGSGVIAFALARELPASHVIAVDHSTEALEVARANDRILRCANVAFFQDDFSSFFSAAAVQGGTFDLIVSNPPYIAEGDPHLRKLAYEPVLALTAGADGLDCLREIIAGAPTRLNDQGWLLVEHGWQQGASVRQLFTGAGFHNIETRRDLAGHERASGGTKP